MNLKFVILLVSAWVILALVMVNHEASPLVASPVSLPQPVVQDDQATPNSRKSLTITNGFLRSCGTALPGKYPTYGDAVILLEELGDGSTVELAPGYAPNAEFGQFSFLKEGDTYNLWARSKSGPNSKEQHLESQDGLVWTNRTNTPSVVKLGST